MNGWGGWEEMSTTDEITRLRLAVVASRLSRPRLAARARATGLVAFTDLLEQLADVEQDLIEQEVSHLHSAGIRAVLLGTPEYPAHLSSTRNAPPFLFYRGPVDLLSAPGIGVCGSRNASEQGLRAAASCGQVAARQGLTVISGYARGVDTATQVAALSNGGTTIAVLPEGIERFRVKRGEVADSWDSKRALVVSQFPPKQTWNVGSAMRRNNVIIGLSLALVVVEASEKGGTLAAGKQALDLNRNVIALEFSKTPRGNAELLRRGAIPVRSRHELSSRLAQVNADSQGNQLSMTLPM
jgi:DNA processing protein